MSRSTALLPAFLLALGLAAPASALPTRYGEGVKTQETVSLAKIVAEPEAWAGKVVRLEGKVQDVCPKRGCWLQLGAEGAAVRVKVEDDVIVFPQTAKGQSAVVEGKVEVLPMSKEQFTGWLAHIAEEKGERFDPASVGDGPYRIIQIQATGAEIGER
ncbi:MAG TPA: DUF4920 domain-containing protein [Thermoanaerobaculia bacterium]|nr:DUF4920 domain-containing protein [Thermoanaerobaculia bacterium]